MKKKVILIISSICLVLLLIGIYLLYRFNYIPHRKYTNADFNISPYRSSIDLDNDGVDDETDILNNAYSYIATKPKYKSKYYASGYPDDEYGVCTDVVGFALLNAGYDLRELVNDDIVSNKELYNIDKIDKNIDFRRVRNLKIYFERKAINLTKDINKIEEWQGGDIVLFANHIAIVSDKRNRHGINFIIHNASPYQREYEEDVLATFGEVLGHYRIS